MGCAERHLMSASKTLNVGRWRGLVLPVALLLVWAFAASATSSPRSLFVSPIAVLRAAHESIADGDLPGAVAATVVRAVLGWGIGALAGFAVGLLLGLSNLGQRVAAPTLHGARQIALFAWIPLLSAWFGNGEAMKLALISLSAFFPILLHVEAGCRNVPYPFREVARLYGFRRLDEILFVILPAAAPTIVSGLELAFVTAWIGTIGAEYLIGTGYMNASPDGIGAFLAGARENARMDLVVVAIVALGTIGFALDRAVVLTSQKAVAWHKQQH
jgi:sulfonate transport system permease protein